MIRTPFNIWPAHSVVALLLFTLFTPVAAAQDRRHVLVGDEASFLVAIRRLQADLVVVDLSLPVAGTRNIVQRLGELFPGLHVVALGVYSEAQAARSVLSAGAAGYVLKGTAGTDLADAIAAVRRGGTYVSPSVDWQPEK